MAKTNYEQQALDGIYLLSVALGDIKKIVASRRVTCGLAAISLLTSADSAVIHVIPAYGNDMNDGTCG